MKFLLIGTELTTRPYAFEFDSDDVKAALEVASAMSDDLQRSILILARYQLIPVHSCYDSLSILASASMASNAVSK